MDKQTDLGVVVLLSRGSLLLGGLGLLLLGLLLGGGLLALLGALGLLNLGVALDLVLDLEVLDLEVLNLGVLVGHFERVSGCSGWMDCEVDEVGRETRQTE